MTTFRKAGREDINRQVYFVSREWSTCLVSPSRVDNSARRKSVLACRGSLGAEDSTEPPTSIHSTGSRTLSTKQSCNEDIELLGPSELSMFKAHHLGRR